MDRLSSVGDEIFVAEGPSVAFLGIPYPTRMAVVRLQNGGLWVWSPIALDESLAAEVAALGSVRHLVAPNKLHHLFLKDWAARWPEARLYAPPGLAQRRKDIQFDADLGDEPAAEWAGEIDQVIFHGSLAMEEVVFFHRASSTALFCDLIQKFDPGTLHGWRYWIMRLDGMVGRDGSTPREWRLSFWNRAAARRARDRALQWQPRQLLIAHGMWVRENGTEELRRSLAWLGG